MQYLTNFEVPTNMQDSEKGKHAQVSTKNQGAFHKMQSQTFFEDLYPQVNTI